MTEIQYFFKFVGALNQVSDREVHVGVSLLLSGSVVGHKFFMVPSVGCYIVLLEVNCKNRH